MSDNLPPEILTQVFLHLSIKTLARLTSVCKYWHSLISSPVFISLHSTARRNSPATTPLLLTWRGPYKDCVKDRLTLHLDDGDGVCELMELECMFGSWRRLNIVRLVGSCNGLVCLFVNDFKESMILWNPRINKIVHVPKPNRGCTYGGKVFLGFGFHPAESDYKVVRVVYRKTDGALPQPHFPPPPDIEVYSLNSGAWRGGGSSIGAAQARGSYYSSYSNSQAFETEQFTGWFPTIKTRLVRY
uniref:F-box domain-containing protein n=1 Tax=Kalanchoe fedtschenkoi TaxID=63787 RepID=A0A7N0T5W6_KALFE